MSSARKRKVMITHAGGRLGLGMARGLMAVEGVHLVSADAGKHNLYRAVGHEKVQIPMASDAAYLPVIKDIIAEKEIDFFWPAFDSEISLVAGDPDLADKTFLPPLEMIEICHSKTLSYEKFTAAGVPVPRSMAVNDEKDLARAFEELGGDIWIRLTGGAGGRGALPVTDFETAKMWIDFHRGWGRFQAAERLPGQRLAWESVWHEGELVFCQSVVPLAIGFSNLTLSGITGLPALNKWVDDPVMTAMGQAAVKAVHPRPHGIMTVDMTVHKDGDPRVTEINIGRFGSGGVVNSHALGFNLAQLTMQLALGETPEMSLPAINPFPHDWWIIFGMSVEPVEVHMREPDATEAELQERLKRLGL